MAVRVVECAWSGVCGGFSFLTLYTLKSIPYLPGLIVALGVVGVVYTLGASRFLNKDLAALRGGLGCVLLIGSCVGVQLFELLAQSLFIEPD